VKYRGVPGLFGAVPNALSRAAAATRTISYNALNIIIIPSDSHTAGDDTRFVGIAVADGDWNVTCDSAVCCVRFRCGLAACE